MTRRRTLRLKRQARTISGRAVEIKRNQTHAALAKAMGWRVVPERKTK